MRAVDDLTMALDDLVGGHLFHQVASQRWNEDVGIALQDDEISRARLYEDVAVEPSQALVPTKSCSTRLPTTPALTTASARVGIHCSRSASRFGQR